MQSCYIYKRLQLCPWILSYPLQAAERSNALNPLHHHRRRRSPAVTDGGDTVLARLELMQQRRQDPRAGAAERVAERDGATEEVDVSEFETENLQQEDRGCQQVRV